MINLFLSIICSALIGNLLSIFQKNKKTEILYIFLGNYFVASIFSYISNDIVFSEVRLFDLLAGFITGCLFLLNFIIYQKNIIKNGLSLSVGVMRMSLLIPTAVAIFFFREHLSIFNYFGIGIIIYSFFFMSDRKGFHNLIWIIILFFITGITETSMKVYNEFGLANQGIFIFLIFFSALILNLVLILHKRLKFQSTSFLYGMILGIPNQLTTRFFLSALKTIPASFAYPFMASAVVTICILCDILFWKMKFSSKQRIALFLMVVGIVLINLRGF